MRIIQKVWGKCRLAVIVILSITIGASVMYATLAFTELKKEESQVWQEHLQRQTIEIKSSGDSVDKATSYSTESTEQPEAAEATRPVFAPTSGEMADILPRIQMLESSGGKNDSCKNKGLVNGYGFSQSTFSWKCYKTKKEVEKEVIDWFKDNLSRYTLAQSVCRYNTGTPSESCPYWEKFQSLNM